MNRHFTDARYYARRTAEELATGLREELEPVESRIRDATGRETDSNATRPERVRQRATAVEHRARERLGDVRQRT